MGDDHGGDATEDEVVSKPNIVLVGVMGCGKTTIGELLARAIGYGFIDVDARIVSREGKRIDEIFASVGEAEFRHIEKAAVASLSKIRSHVISVGGGAILDDDNWRVLKELATIVWIKTSPDEIARRLYMKPDEIRRRPLIQEIVNIEDNDQRQKVLSDRIAAIESQRQQRYAEANVVLEDSYSTPEISSQFLRTMLQRERVI